MGDSPSEVDCAVFGMLSMIYWHMPGSRHQLYIKENLPNLVDYIYRMKKRFWPDWESVTLQGSEYMNDHGKIYFPENMRDQNNDYKKGLHSDTTDVSSTVIRRTPSSTDGKE